MILGGLCWLVFAAINTWLLFQYLQGGAGPLGFVGISSASVLIGGVHFTGLIVASVVCFSVGTCLCAHGLVPTPPEAKCEGANQTDVDSVVSDAMPNGSAELEAVLLCVCCRVTLHNPVQMCPECGGLSRNALPVNASHNFPGEYAIS
jgi:hypothetical protein